MISAVKFPKLKAMSLLCWMLPATMTCAATSTQKLSAEEIRLWLDPQELRAWTKLETDRLSAERHKTQGEALCKPVTAYFKGDPDNAPEARRAKGEAMIRAAEERFKSLEVSEAEFDTLARDRITKSATRVACPVLPMRDALAATVAESVKTAARLGLGQIIPVGMVLSQNGKPERDDGMSLLLIETLRGVSRTAPAESAPKALLVAELQPCDNTPGALLCVRLVDAKSAVIRSVALAVVPSDAAETEKGAAFGLTLEDRRNFFGKLGSAENWIFEVDAADAGACLLKAALLARGKPAVSDHTFLKIIAKHDGGRVSPAKALWTVNPLPGTGWMISSRAAAGGAAREVGALRFEAIPKTTVR